MSYLKKNEHWSTVVANKLYILYVIYLTLLWMTLNYGGEGINPYTGGGIRWFLITVPLLLYIFFGAILLCFNPKMKPDPILLCLLLYIMATALSSLINSDLKHFSEVVRWALPMMLLVHFRPVIPLKVLNWLFLISIAILIINYDPAITSYGYLPGQTTANLHQGMWWRVSIWTYLTPPYSAAFALLVFFANYLLNPSRSRFIYYALALYFLLLSGSRTSYFIFMFCISVLVFLNTRHFRLRLLYRIIPLCAILAIAGLQLFADLLSVIEFKNEVVSSAVLRNDGTEGDVSNLSSRIRIMGEHWSYIQSADFNYGLGVGSKIYDSPEWTSNGGILGGTTDSYVSHLFARDGLAVLFLVLAFSYFFVKAMKQRNLLAYIILLMLIIFTIGYGAWLNFTSPVFLLYLGFLHHPTGRSSKNKGYG